MPLRPLNMRKKLTGIARQLVGAGFSVIPVFGNKLPTEPKKPALAWRRYQTQLPSAGEIKQFFRDGVSAIGIVCGTVSRLLVIDFDDHLRYRRFCRHLPQYSRTLTVKTARGYHVYLRTEENVPTHQFDGGDIKGERSYVLGAGSIIGDFEYTAVGETDDILQVNRSDIDRLLQYFHVDRRLQLVPGRVPSRRSDVDSRKLYARLAPQIGRNNALYRAASLARNAGRTRSRCEAELLRLHVETPPSAAHRSESFAERWQEGKRTIASAYSHSRGTGGIPGGMPNSVRERLLRQQKSTIVARLLDIFQLAGWLPESTFTLKEACELAAGYGMNRKSVLQALTGELSIYNGSHIISRRYVDYLDNRGLKARKRGRPVALRFQVPSVSRLIALLEVALCPADAITEADVRSARQYRLAVHREYIKRLRPEATTALLAGRLGVSGRTVRRYNRALGVRVAPVISSFELSRQALRALPRRRSSARKSATAGFWLEREDGKRLPAWRHVGSRLIREAGAKVWVCMRRGSVFSLAAKAPDALVRQSGAAELLQLRALREGKREPSGWLRKLGRFVRGAGERVKNAAYARVPLFFDTVTQRIAEDKTAESIAGYLLAYDEAGRECRRPARRGIAFRMLKEFGNGKVMLALS